MTEFHCYHHSHHPTCFSLQSPELSFGRRFPRDGTLSMSRQACIGAVRAGMRTFQQKQKAGIDLPPRRQVAAAEEIATPQRSAPVPPQEDDRQVCSGLTLFGVPSVVIMYTSLTDSRITAFQQTNDKEADSAAPTPLFAYQGVTRGHSAATMEVDAPDTFEVVT